MAFKEIGGSRVKFEEIGETVEGQLVAATKIPHSNGEYMRYTVRSGNENKTFNGSYSLDEILPGVKLGTLVRVVYQGKESIGGGKTFNNFKVMVDDGEQQQAASV